MGLQPRLPEVVCRGGEWLNWGCSGTWPRTAFFNFFPSLFNFQVPQSKKPLLKKGSVLGSDLLDDKPVKRSDERLCRVHGVCAGQSTPSVEPCPVSCPPPWCWMVWGAGVQLPLGGVGLAWS